jgi:hypothetical protein
MKAAIIPAAIPALVVVAAAGLALLPLIVLVWRLDRARPARVPAESPPAPKRR